MNERFGIAAREGFVRKSGGLLVALAVLVAVMLAMPFTDEVSRAEEDEAMSANVQLVQDFIAAFNRKDVDAIMGFWGPEPVYHNMPGPPVVGTDAVRQLIESFVNPAEKIEWEILNIAESGDTVLAERVDRFVLGGNEVVLPCNGAFDIVDGKIVEWRDYFDMATWQKQMGN